jgi:hypothetical protein
MKAAAKAEGANLKDFQFVNYLNNSMEELQGKPISASSVSRWLNKRTKKAADLQEQKRGQKVNEQFESDVISQLMISKITSDDTVEVIANCEFSHNCFRVAAQTVRQQQKYLDDPRIQKLQFSDSWIRGLKYRYESRKRKRIASARERSSVDETIQEFARVWSDSDKDSSDDSSSDNGNNDSDIEQQPSPSVVEKRVRLVYDPQHIPESVFERWNKKK